jgi:hypothetical protein
VNSQFAFCFEIVGSHTLNFRSDCCNVNDDDGMKTDGRIHDLEIARDQSQYQHDAIHGTGTGMFVYHVSRHACV